MPNFKLDSSHDLLIGRGATRTSELDYTVQTVKCRLLTILGEWQLDPSKGVPWLEVLSKNYDIEATRTVVRQIIQTSPGVLSVDSLVFQVDTTARLLTITFTATSIYGAVNSEVNYEWN